MLDEYDEQALRLRNAITLNAQLRAHVEKLEALNGSLRAQVSTLQEQLSAAQAERRP